MAQLVVREIDESTIDRLKERAQLHGCTIEEEHRRILEEALAKPEKLSFEAFLGTLPDVFEDEDIARGKSKGRDNDVISS